MAEKIISFFIFLSGYEGNSSTTCLKCSLTVLLECSLKATVVELYSGILRHFQNDFLESN